MATSRSDPTAVRRGTGRRPKAVVLLDSPALQDLDTNVPVKVPEALRDLWHAIIDDLRSRELRPVDLEHIDALVMAANRRRQAVDAIERDGLFVVGPTGALSAHPGVKIERDATMLALRISAEYGLTLATRMRLGLIQLAGISGLAQINAGLDTR